MVRVFGSFVSLASLVKVLVTIWWSVKDRYLILERAIRLRSSRSYIEAIFDSKNLRQSPGKSNSHFYPLQLSIMSKTSFWFIFRPLYTIKLSILGKSRFSSLRSPESFSFPSRIQIFVSHTLWRRNILGVMRSKFMWTIHIDGTNTCHSCFLYFQVYSKNCSMILRRRPS